MIAIHLLEAFVEVAQRGSVTQAAQALGRTQPALSNRLRQLEEELGVALFERAGRGLRLTPAGQALLQQSQALLAGLRMLPQRVLEESREDAAPSGTARIGALPTMARYWLIDALGEAARQMPQVRWIIEPGLAQPLLERLSQGHLDVVYLIGDFDVSGLDVVELAQIQILAVCSPARASQPREQAPLLLWRGAQDPSFDLIERHVRSIGWVGPAVVEIPHIETLRELAVRGLGHALLPDYVVREDVLSGRLLAQPVPDFTKRFALRRYTAQGRRLSAAARGFMRLVQPNA